MTHGTTPGAGFGSPLAAGVTPAPEHCDHDRTFTRIDKLGPMTDTGAVVLQKTIICTDCRGELEIIRYTPEPAPTPTYDWRT